MLKLRLSEVFKAVFYLWLGLGLFVLFVFFGKLLLILTPVTLLMLLWGPTRRLVLGSFRFMVNGFKRFVNLVTSEFDSISLGTHISKQSREAIYVGDIYDEKAKKYYKLHLPLKDLDPVLVYGSPLNILTSMLPQVSIISHTVFFDVEGSLYQQLREVVPLQYLSPSDFPVDPFRLGAEDAYVIFEVAFPEINHVDRAKLKSLILAYYTQKERMEKPSLEKFLDHFLEDKKESSTSRSELAGIERVQDLCCDLLKCTFLNGINDVQKLPAGFLYFDLSKIQSKNARIIYTLTVLDVIHRHWGPVFAVLNGDILPLDERHGRESLGRASQLFNRGVAFCVTNDGCPIDATLLNYAKTVIIGNCIEDYRLSQSIQKMFPNHSPCMLKPMEYLFKGGGHRGLLISPAVKLPEKKAKERKEQATSLEADFDEKAEKAYDMLQKIANSKRMPRPTLLSICEYDDAGEILDKLTKLGYTIFAMEVDRGRYIPVVKLTKKGNNALKEFSLKLQGQIRLEEVQQ